MAKDISKPNQPLVFEQIKRIDENGTEFWSARDLSKALDYQEYRNFLPVVEKAKTACNLSGHRVQDHFVDMHEMISLGKGAQREMESVRLTRYASYLIVQNADPGKEVVALGQTYFAVQTHLQEIQQMEAYGKLSTEDEKRMFLRREMSVHNKQLADVARGAGVIDPVDYAIFQNFGYKGLYGGLDARGIHNKKGLKKSEQILDHMGSTELAANLFRATQTEDKLRRDAIQGKKLANHTHFEIGKKVRKTIEEIGGTMPENLPVVESIKKLDKNEKPKSIRGEKSK